MSIELIVRQLGGDANYTLTAAVEVKRSVPDRLKPELTAMQAGPAANQLNCAVDHCMKSSDWIVVAAAENMPERAREGQVGIGGYGPEAGKAELCS